MKKLLIALIILWMLAFPVFSKPYGEYRKAKCEWCGTKGSIINQLNVHHFIPQHVAPELRDDPDNLVTLCRRCHYCLGHKCNWTNDVREIKVLFTNKMEAAHEKISIGVMRSDNFYGDLILYRR